MTEQDKQLLLQDLCARLSYGVICYTKKGDGYLCSINQTIFGTEYGLNINPLKRDYFNDSETDEQVIKPYLRPMESMTEEECNEMLIAFNVRYASNNNYKSLYIDGDFVEYTDISNLINYLNAHHFDYRVLIEKGLALEAPEGMYENK